MVYISAKTRDPSTQMNSGYETGSEEPIYKTYEINNVIVSFVFFCGILVSGLEMICLKIHEIL